MLDGAICADTPYSVLHERDTPAVWGFGGGVDSGRERNQLGTGGVKRAGWGSGRPYTPHARRRTYVGMSTFDEALHPRTTGGLFARKHDYVQTGTLTASAVVPVSAELSLQHWDHRNNLYELSRQTVDLRAVLDTMPLSRVRNVEYDDNLVLDIMHEQGLVTHTGPCQLDVEPLDLEDYITERSADGQEEPVTGSLHRSADDAANDLVAAQQEMTALRERIAAYQSQYVGSLVRELAPTATHARIDRDAVVLIDASGRRVALTREQEATLRGQLAAYEVHGQFTIR